MTNDNNQLLTIKQLATIRDDLLSDSPPWTQQQITPDATIGEVLIEAINSELQRRFGGAE